MRRLIAVVAVAVFAGSCAGRATEPPSPDASEVPEPTLTSLPSVPETTPQVRFVPNPPPEGSTVCDRFARIVDAGTVESDALTESSGIVASRAHPGVYWLHNDSGGSAAVYAIDDTGAALGEWALDGTFALDWEDIALGPGPDPGVDYLYVGDIGDNLAFRPDVTVQRFPEPDPYASGTVGAVALRLAYPFSPTDAEAMLVDPISGDLVIITKSPTGESVVVRATSTSLGSDPIIPLIEIARVDLGAGAFVTAADIAPDGTIVALRGYDEVWMWERSEADLASAFTGAPCRAPSTDETQGEALTFTADGTAYVTVGEGTNPTVWRVDP